MGMSGVRPGVCLDETPTQCPTQAQGSSVSQLDVLRAIQSYEETLVMTQEIKASAWTEPYSDQTVQQALRKLTEVGLVENVGHGVYRYAGPVEIEYAKGQDQRRGQDMDADT